MKGRCPKTRTVSLLFTLLLFLVFVLCALFMVLIGGRVYENINARTEAAYQQEVALSYIANKVRQEDEAGSISLEKLSGTVVLKLQKEIEGAVYVTEIYYRDGGLWELFADAASNLGLEAGTKIMECSPVSMELEGGMLHIQTEGGGSLWLSLRSEGEKE